MEIVETESTKLCRSLFLETGMHVCMKLEYLIWSISNVQSNPFFFWQQGWYLELKCLLTYVKYHYSSLLYQMGRILYQTYVSLGITRGCIAAYDNLSSLSHDIRRGIYTTLHAPSELLVVTKDITGSCQYCDMRLLPDLLHVCLIKRDKAICHLSTHAEPSTIQFNSRLLCSYMNQVERKGNAQHFLFEVLLKWAKRTSEYGILFANSATSCYYKTLCLVLCTPWKSEPLYDMRLCYVMTRGINQTNVYPLDQPTLNSLLSQETVFRVMPTIISKFIIYDKPRHQQHVTVDRPTTLQRVYSIMKCGAK